MSEVQEEVTCPLGSKCYEIKDNVPHRCAWHVKMTGTDASGADHDEWGCAMTWQPILLAENARTNRGQTAAIESMRNETITRQDAAIKAINSSIDIEGNTDDKIINS